MHMRGKGRPKAILETGETEGKILPLFSFWTVLLGATQRHILELEGNSKIGRKEIIPTSLGILSYRSPGFAPSMQRVQQFSLVERLMVRVFVKIRRLRNKTLFKCLLFTKRLFYI